VEDDQDTFNLTGDYNRGVPSIVGRYTFGDFGEEVLRLMRADEAYVVADIETHQPAPRDLAAYRATMIRSVICVPLHKGGRLVAAMAVTRRPPRRWSDYEVRMAMVVANRCWEALERAKVTRVLEESEERFRTLADNIAQLAWMADAAGDIFWYNRRWFEYTAQTSRRCAAGAGKRCIIQSTSSASSRSGAGISRLEKAGKTRSHFAARTGSIAGSFPAHSYSG
jgi:PAS domain-containing protein